MHLRILFALMTLAFAAAALAQDTNVIAPPDAFQVRYGSNLNQGNSVINVTNTGSDVGIGDNICVNVYTFDQSSEMVSCCSCLVTPNGLASISVQGDLVGNTLSPATPLNVIIKLVSTRPPDEITCNPGAQAPFAPGMRAWGTSLHALPGTPTLYGLTETAYVQAGLSQPEYNRLTSLCNFIKSNGSGFGICGSCRTGGLAGAKN